MIYLIEPDNPRICSVTCVPLRVAATMIIDMTTDAQRAVAIESIPDLNSRAIVRFYVEDYFARRDGTPLPDLKR